MNMGHNNKYAIPPRFTFLWRVLTSLEAVQVQPFGQGKL